MDMLKKKFMQKLLEDDASPNSSEQSSQSQQQQQEPNIFQNDEINSQKKMQQNVFNESQHQYINYQVDAEKEVQQNVQQSNQDFHQGAQKDDRSNEEILQLKLRVEALQRKRQKSLFYFVIGGIALILLFAIISASIFFIFLGLNLVFLLMHSFINTIPVVKKKHRTMLWIQNISLGGYSILFFFVSMIWDPKSIFSFSAAQALAYLISCHTFKRWHRHLKKQLIKEEENKNHQTPTQTTPTTQQSDESYIKDMEKQELKISIMEIEERNRRILSFMIAGLSLAFFILGCVYSQFRFLIVLTVAVWALAAFVFLCSQAAKNKLFKILTFISFFIVSFCLWITALAKRREAQSVQVSIAVMLFVLLLVIPTKRALQQKTESCFVEPSRSSQHPVKN